MALSYWNQFGWPLALLEDGVNGEIVLEPRSVAWAREICRMTAYIKDQYEGINTKSGRRRTSDSGSEGD